MPDQSHMLGTLFHKVLNRLGDKPAQMAFSLSNMMPIRRQLGRRYRDALRRHRSQLPKLKGIDLQIVEALERDGIFVTSLAALGLPGSAEMLRAGQKVAGDCAEGARKDAATMREFICAPATAAVDNPELFHWGLNERLLDIAEAYIGLPVAYDGMVLIYTVADGTELGVRRWHRDREDRRVIKIGIYCNDVTERGGPFELISREDPSQGVDDRYHFEFGTDEVFNKSLGEDYGNDLVRAVGPAGTVVFADTARFFHRGAPAYDHDRAAIYYSYFASRARHPFFCERSGLTRRSIADLTEGLSPRQRASALWQKALPFWLKLIPPAPV